MMGNINCDDCGHDKKMCTCKKPAFVAQEGGEHYQAEYQHWDWVIDAGIGYLGGCATKYVSRWWKKNGLQDLLKAKTYVQKMIVNYDAVYALSVEPPDDIDELNARFRKANKLPELEYQFCCLMSDWQSTQQLEFAMQLLDSLIATAQRALEAGVGTGAVVAPSGAAGTAGAAKTGGAGRAGGTVTQGAASSTSIEPHNKAVDGMEHPFGYDQWAEGPIDGGFHPVNIAKTEDWYNG